MVSISIPYNHLLIQLCVDAQQTLALQGLDLHLLDHTIAGFLSSPRGCDHHFRSKFRDLGGGSEQRGLRDPSANHSYATPTYHLLRQSFIRHSDAVRLNAARYARS